MTIRNLFVAKLLSLSLVVLVASGVAAQDVDLRVSPSMGLEVGDVATIVVKGAPGQLYGVLVSAAPFDSLDQFQGALAILGVMPAEGGISQDVVIPRSIAGLHLYLRAASVNDDGSVILSSQIEVKIG